MVIENSDQRLSPARLVVSLVEKRGFLVDDQIIDPALAGDHREAYAHGFEKESAKRRGRLEMHEHVARRQNGPPGVEHRDDGDEASQAVLGQSLPQSTLRPATTHDRDHELVPLSEDWQEYVEREVKPFVPDAWVDTSYTDAQDGEVGRVGYEINFNRYFYKYVPPRPLEEIDSEMKQLEAEIANLLKEVAG